MSAGRKGVSPTECCALAPSLKLNPLLSCVFHPLFICTSPPRSRGFDPGFSAQCLKDVAMRAKPSSMLDATVPVSCK